MCVSIHPVLWWQGHFVEMAAFLATLARLDEHGVSLETLAIRAHKSHRNGARATRRAAAAIRTHAAVIGPVEADTLTLAIRQTHGFWGFWSRGALLALLGRDGYVTAGPDGAEARLSIQLTLGVVIGDA